MLLKLLAISFAFVIFLFAIVTPSEAKYSFMQGNTSWKAIAGAQKYHIYYKRTRQKDYEYVVVDIPNSSTSYTIKHLQPGIRYWYNVVAVDSSGNKIAWSGLKKLRVSWMK